MTHLTSYIKRYVCIATCFGRVINTQLESMFDDFLVLGGRLNSSFRFQSSFERQSRTQNVGLTEYLTRSTRPCSNKGISLNNQMVRNRNKKSLHMS